MDNLNPPPNNPYASPNKQRGGGGPGNNGKIIAPAIALIVVAGLGLAACLFNIVFALVSAPPQIDPNAPEFFQQMQQSSVGPVAAVVQGVFLLVNLLVLAGGISMLRLRGWGLALTGSIVAMVNCGSGCCLLGLPIGIWSLVILFQEDVKAKFM